jgi:hypothetical protein
MTLNKKSRYFLQLLSLFFVLTAVFSCANVQKPQGGPRDRTPPKLLKATPPNMTRNFTAKQVVLTFDEYFTLKNQSQEITMSPVQEKTPEYKVKTKSIVINFRDSLKKNTTYVINFGKAIADVNEGNVLQNFTYVFSTGPHIDSLSISGSVTNTLTNEKEKEVTVMLIPVNQDSIIFGKKKPSIYASTDTSGNFSLNNLHESDYRIYALKESSPNKIYDNDNELIAFLKKPIHLRRDTSGIHLNLFKQVPVKFRLPDRRFDPADGRMFFTFNRPLEDPSIKITYPPALDDQKITEFNKTRDTAFVYMRNMDFDSIRVAFLEKGKGLDTIYLRKGRKETFKRTINFTYNINANNLIKPGSDLVFNSTIPIASFDPSLITLTEDSVSVANYDLQKDTGSYKKFTIKYPWKQGSHYLLIFDENAFTDIYGDKNKKSQKGFYMDKPENYGNLTLKVTVPDTSISYLVELLNSQKQILRSDQINRTKSIIYKNYITGKYKIRVVYDDNHNGKWDSGNVKQKRQPENIWLMTGEITLRPNWDAEQAVDIPKEPATY